MRTAHPTNGISFLEKYLKTMETFNLLDLHHLLYRQMNPQKLMS